MAVSIACTPTASVWPWRPPRPRHLPASQRRKPSHRASQHLTAALIRAVIAVARVEDSVRPARPDLERLPDKAAAPANVADLGHRVGDVPGVALGRLLAQLQADPATTEGALQTLIANARASEDVTLALITRHLAAWERSSRACSPPARITRKPRPK